MPVTPASPSIFTLTQSGKGQGAILNYDAERKGYSVNGTSNGAARGSVVVLFATGAGQTNPQATTG